MMVSTFIVQVFRKEYLFNVFSVEAETEEDASRIAKELYPGCTISVHSVEQYGEIVSSCPHRLKEKR